jgi:dienelactone hydrolase
MQTRLIIAVLVLIIVAFIPPLALAQEIDYKGFPEWSLHTEGKTEYALYTPSNVEPSKRYPVAIFLHGCCGQDEHATFRNAVDPPARMWHNFGANTQIIPTYIISPKTTRGWQQKFEDIKKVVDDLIAAGKVDPQRIYMTGFSMGGGGTWQFMEQYPGYIAAAIPMGSGARADFTKVKDTPVWAIQGEKDYFARSLSEQIAEMRKLNGYDMGAGQWVTGVNPRYTNFAGLDHGIQWDAASTLPLLQWAYSHVNDGNHEPVIYFESPGYRQTFEPDEPVDIDLQTFDPDGEIEKVEVFLDGKLQATLTGEPYKAMLKLTNCNNLVEAVVHDNQGKTAKATNVLLTPCTPEIKTARLPDARRGSMYSRKLNATGNAPFEYTLAESSKLPVGLALDAKGLIHGIPQKANDSQITITVKDADGQTAERTYSLNILEKLPSEVVVTDITSPNDLWVYTVGKVQLGALPNTQAGTEVSFSRVGDYEGLTYISTSQRARDCNEPAALSFVVDEDVTLYVAYERLDNLFTSTIPDWLNSYRKVDSPQIVAQYHYFDVYEKQYAKGRIDLPGADAAKNNVLRNYFVMVEKK